MPDSFDGAARKLRTGTGRIGDEVESVLHTVALDVVDAVEPLTPVATGRLASSWEVRGTSVVNDAPYASDAAGGVAEDLVRGALSELEQDALQDIQRRINQRMGWP